MQAIERETIDRPDPIQAQPRRPRLRRVLTISLTVLLLALAVLAGYVALSYRATENDIAAHRQRVEALAAEAGPPAVDAAALAELPEPVQRWVDHTFPEGTGGLPTVVTFEMEGDFRRPLTETFSPTTAEQTSAVATPAFVFSATTTMVPGLWARAYDAFGEGEMEMKAKILSTLTVVDEVETPALNQTSLQRWLLISPMYPAAMLPGGHVRWEAVDADRARAIVSADGREASLVATFRADGSLQQFDAEVDGDLTTPYHGSGEHALYSDYRLVDGLMIPHRSTFARAAGGQTYPFWTGAVTSVAHDSES